MNKSNMANEGYSFKTTHKLEINIVDKSPFPGYAAFALGGVAGFFSVNEISVDFIVGDITVPMHIVDVVEWFDEVASQDNKIGVRVMNCTNQDLRAVLIHGHGFRAIRQNILFKQVTRKN